MWYSGKNNVKLYIVGFLHVESKYEVRFCIFKIAGSMAVIVLWMNHIVNLLMQVFEVVW